MSDLPQGQCPAPSWITTIAQQDVEILNRRNQVFLDLHTPQPSPARAVKPIAGPSGKGAFHEVLTYPDIPPCRSGSTACPHAIEGVLAQVPRDRAPGLIVRALAAQGTGGTHLLGRRVVDGLATAMQRLAPQGLVRRTPIGIRGGVIGELGIPKVFPPGRPLVRRVFEVWQMRGDPAIVAGEKILDRPVSAVRHDGVRAAPGGALMALPQRHEEMRLVDVARAHLHRRNHLTATIHRPMRLIPERGFAAPDNGGVRIRRRHIARVDRSRIQPLGRLRHRLVQPGLQLAVRAVQLGFERLGIHNRVIRGMGIDEATVEKNLGSIDQPASTHCHTSRSKNA